MAHVGLSNRYALEYLCDEIENVLDHFIKKRNDVQIFDSIRNLHENSCLTLTSLSFICILLVIISIEYMLHSNLISLCNTLVIFILISINFYANEYNYKISQIELFDKIRKAQKQLKDFILKSEHWTEDVFPNIYLPTAPCITLQWTVRDGKVVNLPWSLLVENDLILMRPGQESPALCRPVDQSSNIPILKRHEIFNKNDPCFPVINDFSTPRIRDPLECHKFILLETPYLDNLSLALDLFHQKEITYDNKLRKLLIMQFIEYYLVLLIIFVTVLIQCLYLGLFSNLLPVHGFYDLFLLQNALIVTPLLPMVFPIFWIVSNVLGITRLKILFDAMLNSHKNTDHEIQINKSLFTYAFSVKNVKLFWNLFTCKENLLSRTANALHVLANITSLCCVDKKGILSWPNTTPEKVFFLDKNEDFDKEPSQCSNTNQTSSKVHYNFNQNSHNHNNHTDDSDTCNLEILDLTHTQSDSFSVRFDDRKWDTFLNNLKPIGLGILMNTCNPETQAHYYKFCTHVTCESTFSETLVPVANRRCLCTLSKEIGFRDQATASFLLKHQLSSFRHLESDVVKRNNKFARTVRISSKLKFPFPHMAAVTFQDRSTGDTQMFSQGTADMILDFCVDYWNGDDVVPLTSANRKRILDFYYRYSLTSYCTTFSYKPLIKLFDKANDFSQQYLELPSDYRNLHKLLENKCISKLREGHSHSSESIVLDDVVNESVSNQYLNMQYNQVFLGIVTLQYKPFKDVIYLIELLEKACIRFIHFSKENELRSRVFGEKLGLESGWNCHISLVSDCNRRSSDFTDQFNSGKQTLMTSPVEPYFNNKTGLNKSLSVSAPSCINLDGSTVKFDVKNEEIPFDKISYSSIESDERFPKSNNFVSSLSCMTDSTEHSVPVNFDISNRARLPRGIENIRPHLEFVDNVPLLVSLFTDCVPFVTQKMIKIMQDYGEIVCVIGSAANSQNMPLFLQGNASISIEPLYPQVCCKDPVVNNFDKFNSPIYLNHVLNSITCSFSFWRSDQVSIYSLIMEARCYMLSLWNVIQFWLSCNVTLTILQFLGTTMLLPPILRTSQVLWLCIVVIPILSASLMNFETCQSVMMKPLGKNRLKTNKDAIIFIIWCYGFKFLTVILSVLVVFVLMLNTFCEQLCSSKESVCECKMSILPVTLDSDGISSALFWDTHKTDLNNIQCINFTFILINFVIISLSFVYREFSFWKKIPFQKLSWCLTVFLIFILHAIFIAISSIEIDQFHKYVNEKLCYCATLFLMVVLLVTEIIKHYEIVLNIRYGKRVKLDFDTKLGMNSPF